jgi:hypothetical protein
MRLADVSLLARDVHGVYALGCAPGQPRAPVKLLHSNGLISVIEGRTGLAIEIKCLPWNGHMIRATMRRYGDRASILYSSDLNVCWSRFCICKEAYHLLSNDQNTYSTDPVSLVTGLLNDIPVVKIDDDVEAEWMAVFGAMELLVPKALDNHLYQLEASGKSHYEIALEFRVPEKIISLRLSPAIRSSLDVLHREMR